MDEELKNQNILTSAALEEQPSPVFRTLTVPQVPNIEVPEPTIQDPNALTGGEQQVQTGMEEIQALNKQLLGESELRTQQEEKQGLPELLQTQTDLQGRVAALAAEQQAIPLQLQQESIGRGRTVGGVEPLQTARLRENAINALSTNALLSATQGNISTAQTLVDRAVAAKFDPIREELNVKSENLQLIIDSPQYSAEQKKRAEEQKAQVDAQNAQITKQEAEMKGINDIAVETAKFGASIEVLQAIRNAGSILEATAIAQTTGLYNVEQMQQDFENSLKTGEFNLKKQKLQQDIQQQAFDNDLSIMSFELDRDKFATDTEFKNAQLVLDQMKADWDVSKIQADISKIYDDIARRDEVTVDDLKKINDLEEAKDKKRADEIAKNTQLGNEYTEVDNFVSDLEEMMNSNALSAVVGTGLGNVPLKERFTKGWLKDPESQWLRGKIHQLTSKETLNSLIGLKAKGGTLGAISEKELKILEDSATLFGDWEKKEKDENGNVVASGAWDISEKRFKEELQTIIDSQKRLKEAVLNERLANTDEYTSTMDFETFATDEQVDAFDAIKSDNPGISDQDIVDLMNEEIRRAKSAGYGGATSFNQVGGDTNQADFKISSVSLGSRLAKVNNNPGNLRLANQTGASQGEGGFARFETPEQGVQALKNDLQAKITGNSPAIRGKLGRDAKTLREIISVFAPAEDNNDPNSYSNFVAREMGISPDEPVENLINRLDELTRAFMRKESSSSFA